MLKDRKFAFAGLSLLSVGLLVDVSSLFFPVNFEPKRDSFTFVTSLIGLALSLPYFTIIHTSFGRNDIEKKKRETEIGKIQSFVEKKKENLEIVLRDYEAYTKEVERRENITVLIGSILITSSLLILGNTAMSNKEVLFPYALTSILLFILWLFVLHATTREEDNIAYERLKILEEALSSGNEYSFGIHSYLTVKTADKRENKKGKRAWWLILRRQFWGFVLILLCSAWLILSAM